MAATPPPTRERRSRAARGPRRAALGCRRRPQPGARTLDCVLAELNTVETEWAAGPKRPEVPRGAARLASLPSPPSARARAGAPRELDDALRAAHTEGEQRRRCCRRRCSRRTVRARRGAAAWRQRIADAEAAALLESDRGRGAAGGPALRDGAARALACGAPPRCSTRHGARGVLRCASRWCCAAGGPARRCSPGARAAEARSAVRRARRRWRRRASGATRRGAEARRDARAASEEHARQLGKVPFGAPPKWRRARRPRESRATRLATPPPRHRRRRSHHAPRAVRARSRWRAPSAWAAAARHRKAGEALRAAYRRASYETMEGQPRCGPPPQVALRRASRRILPAAPRRAHALLRRARALLVASTCAPPAGMPARRQWSRASTSGGG